MIETYFSILAAIVFTAIGLVIVAGCGFTIYAMWVAMKDRLWPL